MKISTGSSAWGGAAPEQPPGQPPPEALAEQADQCGENGERGGRRHSRKLPQRARLVNRNNICDGFGGAAAG